MKNALSPAIPITLFLVALVALIIVTTAIALADRGISLNETQIMYLFSTSAQVIATIYGLTLTGFVFFRNELNREESEDETLSDAVENLKARYYVLLVFITVLVFAAILLANLAISYEAFGSYNVSIVIFNITQSTFITSLIAIAYFIFDVIEPRRIERASRALQKQVDPIVAKQAKGSLEEFVQNYVSIETLLDNAANIYQEIAPHPRRRISNTRLAEILLRSERIDKVLYLRLKDLITLRNSIIHGAEPRVSQEMVDASRDVLQKLRESLDRKHGE